MLRQFFTDSNLSQALRSGILKHRGADGSIQRSQLFPDEYETQQEVREVCPHPGDLLGLKPSEP